MNSPNIRRADFFPVGPLHNKQNYKRYFYVGKDGSVLERVHLNVYDSFHREHLICCHYLLHLSRHFLRAGVGVNVLGRDDPWDFTLQLSSGDAFFLEITSIADSAHHFELNTREERFLEWAGQPYIPFHELRKLAEAFPADDLEQKLEVLRDCKPSDLVPNPLAEGDAPLFVGSMPEPERLLSDHIRTAIERKVAKPHEGKSQTVLIIDNRSGAYDLMDYRGAVKELEPFLSGLPFREVWFYTGYCSDDDGNNAEFSFAPLKIRRDQESVLSAMEVDSKGRHVW